MNELTVRNDYQYSELEKIAAAMSKSGYFQDARDASQAIVKVLAGREMGFGPFASMTGVYIIQGRPSVGANLMAAAVKSSGRYDYRVLELTDSACEIEYFQTGKSIGKSRFTLEDARKAGTKNLDKFPRNMLFARAMSNGIRWFCPDVFNGSAVYTPEELGANVAEDGNVIDVQPVQVRQPEPAAVTAARELGGVVVDAPPMTYEEACAVENSKGQRYGDIDTATLEGMVHGINIGIKKPGADVATYTKKLQAIGIILAARENDAEAARAAENE